MKRLVIAALIVAAVVTEATAQPRSTSATKPDGEIRWALYVTLAPAWFDPGETTAGFLTPFWVLYALHDALVKPMPSLAESWTTSADQRTYDFKLRDGLKFHNGDPFTADDVKFSFQRVRELHAGRRAGHGGLRRVLAQGPVREGSSVVASCDSAGFAGPLPTVASCPTSTRA